MYENVRPFLAGFLPSISTLKGRIGSRNGQRGAGCLKRVDLLECCRINEPYLWVQGYPWVWTGSNRSWPSWSCLWINSLWTTGCFSPPSSKTGKLLLLLLTDLNTCNERDAASSGWCINPSQIFYGHLTHTSQQGLSCPNALPLPDGCKKFPLPCAFTSTFGSVSMIWESFSCRGWQDAP